MGMVRGGGGPRENGAVVVRGARSEGEVPGDEHDIAPAFGAERRVARDGNECVRPFVPAPRSGAVAGTPSLASYSLADMNVDATGPSPPAHDASPAPSAGKSSLNTHLDLRCGAQLQNRLGKAAMTEGLSDELNRATDRLVTLYRRWARGGAGLLLTGNVQVDRRYLERPGNVVVDGKQSLEQMARLERWAQSVEGTDAVLWMQISHAGRQSPKSVAREPVAPSAVPIAMPGGQFAKPRALRADEVEDVIARFAHTADVARQTGFGGVQIHGAHGYLLSEFLNPRVNRRDDQWGGSLENRARLLLRVVAAVREAVGPSFPVAVKLNSSDFQKGGFSFAECLRVVEWLNDSELDLLEISGGSYEQPRMMDLDGMEAPVETGESEGAPAPDTRRESTRRREAYFLEYAEQVAGVAEMPLMVTGGFRTRAAMEAALESGAADVIGVARPLCVEVDGPRELLEGSRPELTSFEKTLRLGPGRWLGPQSPSDLIKAVNGFGAMAFFYENLDRLGDGLEPRRDLGLLSALVRHQRGENRMAQSLQER